MLPKVRSAFGGEDALCIEVGEIGMESYKHLYSNCFKNKKNYLHFAAHSHHPWPDCTLKAHEQYWLDSAKYLDEKWNHIFENIIPETQKNIAEILNLSRPQNIAIAPNTHEFVVRLFSCFDFSETIKILTTDSEFHSFRRQLQRYSENPNVSVEIVPVEPYETFEDRWVQKVATKNFDMIFTSHVFFNSGLTCVEFPKWIPHVPPETMIVIDGYHSFCAIPLDLQNFEDRIFFIAGGYKYAQAGEGVCFMSIPHECELRPANTGWFASFETLATDSSGGSIKAVSYSKDGMRFAGSTYDPSGCYRLNAVCKMLKNEKLNIQKIHKRIMQLKKHFIKKVAAAGFVTSDAIVTNNGAPTGSHFVTIRTPKAQDLQKILEKEGIVTDCRGDRLRFGFGLYHDLEDIDILCKSLTKIGIKADPVLSVSQLKLGEVS